MTNNPIRYYFMFENTTNNYLILFFEYNRVFLIYADKKKINTFFF